MPKKKRTEPIIPYIVATRITWGMFATIIAATIGGALAYGAAGAFLGFIGSFIFIGIPIGIWKFIYDRINENRGLGRLLQEGYKAMSIPYPHGGTRFEKKKWGFIRLAQYFKKNQKEFITGNRPHSDARNYLYRKLENEWWAEIFHENDKLKLKIGKNMSSEQKAEIEQFFQANQAWLKRNVSFNKPILIVEGMLCVQTEIIIKEDLIEQVNENFSKVDFEAVNA